MEGKGRQERIEEDEDKGQERERERMNREEMSFTLFNNKVENR